MKDDSRTPRSSSWEEQTFLELVKTTELLSQRLLDLIKEETLSRTQYNVLRILRGAPDGLCCGEIGERLITPDPDITRLLDRLETRRLVSRSRDARDRRTVVTRITAEGLATLTRLDGPVQTTHRRQMGHLGPARLTALRKLLIACRNASG